MVSLTLAFVRVMVVIVLASHASYLWLLRPPVLDAPGDFAGLWASVVGLAQGLDPYEPSTLQRVADEHRLPTYYGPLNYPPLVLALLAPLGSLPFDLAARVWLGLLALASIGTVLLLLRQLPATRGRPFLATVFVLGALAHYPVQWNLIFGNINSAVTLLLTMGLGAVGGGILGRVALAMALAVKVTPAVFVVAHAGWTRQWRRVLTIGLWAAGLSVAGGLLTGPTLAVNYIVLRAPRFLSGDYANPITYPYNQSVGGLFARLFVPGGDTTPWVVAPALAQIGHALVALTVLGVTLWIWALAHRAGRSSEAEVLALPLAIILPSYSHAYYAVWLLPCFAVALTWLARRPRSLGTVAAAAALFASYALTGFAYDYNAPMFHEGVGVLLTSLPAFGVLILWGTLVLMARASLRRQAPGAYGRLERDVSVLTEPAAAPLPLGPSWKPEKAGQVVPQRSASAS